MKTILLGLLLIGQVALAKGTHIKADTFFTDANGQKLEATVALMTSVKGETVYKCQIVEAKVSKSGSGVSLHTVKTHSEDSQ